MSTFAFEPAESDFEDVEAELSMSEDEWIAKMIA